MLRRFEAQAGLVVLALAAAIAAMMLVAEPRALEVVDASPSDGATDVPRAAQVTVTFSRPLDAASGQADVTVTPDTAGFVSVAGRRAAFTPRFGFRGDTTYTVRLGAGIRDRGGRTLAREVVFRFHTQPLRLVLRTGDGRLLRASLGGRVEPLAGGRIGEFAVSAEGTIAYVRPDEGALFVEPAGQGAARRISLPPGLDVRELAWAPRGRVLLLLAASGGSAGSPFLVRLDATTPAVEPFGPRAGTIDPSSILVTEALKKSLVEIVYRQESFAFTPDGRAAIVRDQNWDLAVFGLDGERRGNLGPFLAVGNATPRGDVVAVVDVNPADPTLRRQVLGYRVDGRGTHAISLPEQDSHSPRFAHQTDRVVFATGAAIGSPRERRFALQVVDVATGAWRRLTDPPAGQSDEAAEWSPDDAWISFRRAPVGRPELATVWIVAADGGAARPVEPPAIAARWSP